MNNKTRIISVSAISGGGKTTITKALQAHFKKSQAFYFDDYEYSKQPSNIGIWVENGSNPGEWDLSLIEKDINCAALSGEYDYIFIDYPFGKKEGYTLKSLIDIAFFIDTPLDLALARRMVRDFSNRHTKDIIKELKIYPSIRKYFVYTDDDKGNYDFIIDGSKPVDEITQEIKVKLSACNFTKER